MKRLIEMAALCIAVCVSGPVFAGNDYVWNTDTGNWTTPANWDLNYLYPGCSLGDTATIADADSDVTVNTDIPKKVKWVWLTAAVLDTYVMLDVAHDLTIGGPGTNYLRCTAGDRDAGDDAYCLVSGGTFDIDGEVELNGSSAADAIAEMEVSSGATVTPDSFDLNGGNSSSRTAGLDFNESVTVQSSGTDDTFDTIAEGYTWIDIITSETFDAREMMVDASAGYAEIHQKTGTGTVQANELRISAGDTAGWNGFYWLEAGILDVNGEVELNALNDANTTAEMQVDPSTTFTPNSFDLNGGTTENRVAILDFNESVTVQGVSGTDTSFAGYCDVELAPDVDFQGKEVYLEAGSDVLVSHTAEGGGTLSYTMLTVDNATLRVSNASVE
ncbi:MAG: hypothetical protein JSU86_11765 [Phycisphaerales bacterium]|nr:MAG: hypothetical protein JSU86_11765 [Phycisphaerales bacterium]